jgi:hypothetical protein
MTKVFIVNRSFHDFSEAKKYGELVYLSEGSMDRYEINNMARQFKSVFEQSTKDDYIVLCSLNSMNAIACSIFAVMHGTLNLLLFKQGKGYIERNLIL